MIEFDQLFRYGVILGQIFDTITVIKFKTN